MKRVRLAVHPVEIVGPFGNIRLHDESNDALDQANDRDREQYRLKTGNK